MKKLMITADDFGFTDNTNRGIIETVEHGVTTEVSLMMNSFGTDNAISYVKSNKWKNVGIHLSLYNTSLGEKPYRSSDYDRVLKIYSASKLQQIVSDEIKKFEDNLGFTPSHLNGYKQLQFNEKLIDFTFDYAKRNNVYVRNVGSFHSDTIINSNEDFVKTKIKEYGINIANYVFGLEYDFDNPILATEKYRKILKLVKDSEMTEILFHPGYCDEFEKSLTSFIRERESDRILLCSSEFKEMLIQENFIF